MVDVGGKPPTRRIARAAGVIEMRPETLKRIISGRVEKGNVLHAAQLAGIMGAKRCADLIPLCHPLELESVELEFTPQEEAGRITVEATVKSTGKTGVEMEALTAVAIALLTIYDMCKAYERGMKLGEIQLLEKRGGKSGEWVRDRAEDRHKREEVQQVGCWVITVSDTRTMETDESGKLIMERLKAAGHRVLRYEIVKDEADQIARLLREAGEASEVQAVILSGGTGISARDVTVATVREFLDKELEGFGELFRGLSFAEVGPFALLSQATAGVMGSKLIFSLPGSLDAVRLAVDRLIVPVLGHAVHELERHRLR